MKKPINRIIKGTNFADDWPELDRLDGSSDAFGHRCNELVELLENSSDLSPEESSAAIFGVHISHAKTRASKTERQNFIREANERAARWGRENLKRLRSTEKGNRDREYIDTSAPVLSEGMIGRSELADLAVSLLTAIDIPGSNLSMFIAELLDVDRYRRSRNEQVVNAPMSLAAQIYAQNPDASLSELSLAIGVNKSTVSRWKKRPEFQDLVDGYRQVFFGPRLSDDSPTDKNSG